MPSGPVAAFPPVRGEDEAVVCGSAVRGGVLTTKVGWVAGRCTEGKLGRLTTLPLPIEERSKRGRPRPEDGKTSDVGWTARDAPCEHAYQGKEHGPREWRAWRLLLLWGQGRPRCLRAQGKARLGSRPPVSPLRRDRTGSPRRGKLWDGGCRRPRARSIASTQRSRRSRGGSPYFPPPCSLAAPLTFTIAREPPAGPLAFLLRSFPCGASCTCKCPAPPGSNSKLEHRPT